MRNHSLVHHCMIAAGLVLTFAAAPFTHAMAAQSNEAAQQSSDNRTVPDKAADAWITTKVKTGFGTDKTVPATDINVNTTDGVVTPSDTVGSTSEKAQVVNAARQVKGVKNVDASGLTVSPNAQP